MSSSSVYDNFLYKEEFFLSLYSVLSEFSKLVDRETFAQELIEPQKSAFG